jgi:hypothetical protein
MERVQPNPSSMTSPMDYHIIFSIPPIDQAQRIKSYWNFTQMTTDPKFDEAGISSGNDAGQCFPFSVVK